MLIVVGILVVLAGLSFVAVTNYLRSLTQTERDGYAKEIFIAAQNHLVMAEHEGYLGNSKYGTIETVKAASGEDDGSETETNNDKEVYYFVVNGGSAFSDSESVLTLMLPFGSIDDTIRLGGSYVIRYQIKPALVLDVFYSSADGRYPHQFAESEYSTVLELKGDDNHTARRNCLDGAVIGWYGSEDAAELAEMHLQPPTLEVVNAEKLTATVKNANEVGSLQLIMTGRTSEKQKAIQLNAAAETVMPWIKVNSKDSYTLTLDDITVSDRHFSQLFSGEGFIPGEDISLRAVAYDNTALSNIAYSAEKITNSLFAEVYEPAAEPAAAGEIIDPPAVPAVPVMTARIANIRHLENLDDHISNLSYDGEKLKIQNAEQVSDMSWTEFQTNVKSTQPNASAVCVYDVAATGKKNTEITVESITTGYFMPITQSYSLKYDGKNHRISDVAVMKKEGVVTDAGLFGSPASLSEVKNLELLDFTVTGTTSAGALAGTLNGTKVTNVIARNTGTDATTKSAVNIEATGAAGGLIGILNGGSVNYSAAALIVNGNTAGGLIGTTNNTAPTIVGCYSAGHTKDGSYQLWTDGDSERSLPSHPYDVTGATAGGLIGNAGSSAISYSYSTCSVNASSRGGGFAAITTGVVTKCYCTGRVLPDFADGTLIHNAFRTQLEEGGLADGSSGYYYKIINEVQDPDTKQIEYKDPYRLPGSGTTPAIVALDENAADYNTFVGLPTGWKNARPYDKAALGKYYDGKYNLKTVLQLAGSSAPDGADNYYVSVHYGDWPAPEIFIINSNT